MYDRPETQAANDRLWANIQAHLATRDPHVPRELCRPSDIQDHWRDPRIILSQTCGLPYRLGLHKAVKLVGTPVLTLDCPDGYYYSVVIQRRGAAAITVNQSEVTLAINDPHSQSGWAAANAWLADHGVTPTAVIETGGHRASAQAVAEGQADIATIDAVTWEFISRWDDFARDLASIDSTQPTPTLPYICAPGVDDALVFDALSIGIAGLDQADKDLLCLKGVTKIDADAYLSVPMPPNPPE